MVGTICGGFCGQSAELVPDVGVIEPGWWPIAGEWWCPVCVWKRWTPRVQAIHRPGGLIVDTWPDLDGPAVVVCPHKRWAEGGYGCLECLRATYPEELLMTLTCTLCGLPVAPGVFRWQSETGGPVAHVVCPTPAEIERRRRLGRGPDHTAQLVTLYPVGARGRYV